MARRGGARISLFPFMSVLACTIGALILLLTSLALSAVAPRGARSARDAGELGAPSGAASEAAVLPARPGAEDPAADGTSAVARAREEDDERIARLEALLARLDALLAARAEATGSSVEAIERSLREAGAGHRLAAEREALAAERAAFEGERATIETRIEVLESRRATLPILIDPTGLSRHYDPWFVECDTRGATLHNIDDGFTHFVPQDEIPLSSELPRYLRRLRAMPGSLLVLLVRTDGLRTAAAIRESAKRLDVRVGELPLPGRGEIDWSLLRERRAEARR